jgi:autotransporter-associated beta strand protein
MADLLASLTGAATSQILLGASELTVGASSSASTNFAGTILGTGGSIVKDGTNTQIFSGANTYAGTTTVSGGTLLVNNTTGSGTGTGAVTVSNSGTILGGSGTVAGNLTVNAGAVIAPGSAASTAGTLTIGGSTVVINGNINFDYTTATGNVGASTYNTLGWWSTYSGSLLTGNSGQSNDLLKFTAETTSLSWNTGGKISLNQIGSAYSWSQGDVFNLVDWTSLSGGAIDGSFNSAIDFNLPTLSGGLAWDTSRFVTTGAIAVVPEPGRALLMLFGLMALFFRRR